MKPLQIGSCRECCWFEHKDGDARVGFCRFNPPHSHMLPIPNAITRVLQMQAFSVWPTTEENSWCGRWEPTADSQGSDSIESRDGEIPIKFKVD